MCTSKPKNRSLSRAQKSKRDEFYTLYADIEEELQHYEHHFAGKIVYCNCDDARVSNFFRYFANNFERLKLKKLIASCYKNRQPDLFGEQQLEQAFYVEYEGRRIENRIPTIEEMGINYLKDDGDFRSPECVALLKQSDIVVTNPPFSLLRNYLVQLVKYNKKFLILGRYTALTCKQIFDLVKNNKIWLRINADIKRFFKVPEHYALNTKDTRIDEDGGRYEGIAGICWFTNLERNSPLPFLTLHKTYDPEQYPKYDNYDAIEVANVADIPVDYTGVMGVPITFIGKYNPEQFEIVGITRRRNTSYLRTKIYSSLEVTNVHDINSSAVIKTENGYKVLFTRILIKHKTCKNVQL